MQTGVSTETGQHVLKSEHISTSSLMDFRKKEQFSDVVIDVFGVKIAAHKIVLAANSDFFQTLFCSPLNEISGEVVTFGDSTTDRARWGEIGLRDFSGSHSSWEIEGRLPRMELTQPAVIALIDYLYTGCLQASSSIMVLLETLCSCHPQPGWFVVHQ